MENQKSQEEMVKEAVEEAKKAAEAAKENSEGTAEEADASETVEKEEVTEETEEAKEESAGRKFFGKKNKKDKKDEKIEELTDKVIRQMPASSAVVNSGSVVVLYTEDVENKTVTVPDIVGKSLSQVKSKLSSSGLNLSIVGAGATGSSSDRTVAATQTPAAGSQVPQGSVVKVEFRFKDVEGTVD